MPQIYKIEKKSVILKKKGVQKVIEFYRNAVQKHIANFPDDKTDTEKSEINSDVTKIRSNWKSTLFPWVEALTNKEFFDRTLELPSFSKSLGEQSFTILQNYITYLSKLCNQEGKPDKQIAAKEIDSRYVLTKELLIRLAVIALCEEENSKADGEILLDIMQDFINELLVNQVLNTNYDGVLPTKPSNFDIAFSTNDHGDFINDLRSVVNTVKALLSNKRAFTETLKYLQNSKEIIVRQIIVILNPNIEKGELSKDHLEKNLEKYEALVLEKISAKAIVIRSENNSWKSTKVDDRHRQICQIIINKSRLSIVKNIEALYELLAMANRLYGIVSYLDSIISLLSWAPIITGVIDFNQLIKKITTHTKKCAILNIKDNEFLKTSAGRELITYQSVSTNALKNASLAVFSNLTALANETNKQLLINTIMGNIKKIQELDDEEFSVVCLKRHEYNRTIKQTSTFFQKPPIVLMDAEKANKNAKESRTNKSNKKVFKQYDKSNELAKLIDDFEVAYDTLKKTATPNVQEYMIAPVEAMLVNIYQKTTNSNDPNEKEWLAVNNKIIYEILNEFKNIRKEINYLPPDNAKTIQELTPMFESPKQIFSNGESEKKADQASSKIYRALFFGIAAVATGISASSFAGGPIVGAAVTSSVFAVSFTTAGIAFWRSTKKAAETVAEDIEASLLESFSSSQH